VRLWGVQLEVGSIATPLEKQNYALALIQCQRFYQVIQIFSIQSAIGVGYAMYASTAPPVNFRSTPSAVILDNFSLLLSGFVVGAQANLVFAGANATVAGTTPTLNINIGCSSEL
jgi:hypothetical protein